MDIVECNNNRCVTELEISEEERQHRLDQRRAVAGGVGGRSTEIRAGDFSTLEDVGPQPCAIGVPLVEAYPDDDRVQLTLPTPLRKERALANPCRSSDIDATGRAVSLQQVQQPLPRHHRYRRRRNPEFGLDDKRRRCVIRIGLMILIVHGSS